MIDSLSKSDSLKSLIEFARQAPRFYSHGFCYWVLKAPYDVPILLQTDPSNVTISLSMSNLVEVSLGFRSNLGVKKNLFTRPGGCYGVWRSPST